MLVNRGSSTVQPRRGRRADFARLLRRDGTGQDGTGTSSALLGNDGGRRREKFPSSFNTTHLVLNLRPQSGIVSFFCSRIARSLVGDQLNAAQVLFVLPFHLTRARPSLSHFFLISPFPCRQSVSVLLYAAMPGQVSVGCLRMYPQTSC